MKRQTSSRQQGGSEFLFSILLFFVFLLCSVFTILIGSRVYENIRVRDDRTFHTDTVLAYVTNKVRQSDNAGDVRVREIEGRQVLVLTMEGETANYETWIYTLDGKLKELFAEENSGLLLQDGLDIMDCSSLSFSMESDDSGAQMLTAALAGSETVRLSLRSGRKGDSRP